MEVKKEKKKSEGNNTMLTDALDQILGQGVAVGDVDILLAQAELNNTQKIEGFIIKNFRGFWC